jgi:hypothetical protein
MSAGLRRPCPGSLVAAAAMAAFAPARVCLAGLDLVLAGPVDAVVAAGDRVAVVQDGQVRLLSADGRALRRLGTAAPTAARATTHPRRDDVLDLYDVPEEDRDSTASEDLVEEDLTVTERRRPPRPPPEARAPPLVAGAGEEIWALAAGAIWHVDARGRATRSAGLIPRLDRLAADLDGHLVAAIGPEVSLSSDGGVTFVAVARADGPVRALAVDARRIAWATDRRLGWTGLGERSGSVALPGRALDLAACEGSLLALHGRGLLVVDRDGVPRAVVGAPPAQRVGCGSDGGWWLVGPGVTVSHDGGASFVGPAGLPELAVVDAAPGPRGLWLATAAGLFLSDGRPGGVSLLATPPLSPLRPRWTTLLPRVVVAASSTVVEPGRRDLRTLAYADFPLGEPPHPAVPAPAAGIPAVPAAPPPDENAGCLRRARQAAVDLALADPERARSLVARAGRGAWLPELRLRIDRRLGRSESLDLPVGSVSGPLGLDTVNDVRYEARATWDLSRLVFDADEIAAEAQALRMADVRRELESLVNRLYFERRRLTMDLSPTPSGEATDHARRALRAEELEAELDAVSGGAFARCLAGRSR